MDKLHTIFVQHVALLASLSMHMYIYHICTILFFFYTKTQFSTKSSPKFNKMSIVWNENEFDFVHILKIM